MHKPSKLLLDRFASDHKEWPHPYQAINQILHRKARLLTLLGTGHGWDGLGREDFVEMCDLLRDTGSTTEEISAHCAQMFKRQHFDLHITLRESIGELLQISNSSVCRGDGKYVGFLRVFLRTASSQWWTSPLNLSIVAVGSVDVIAAGHASTSRPPRPSQRVRFDSSKGLKSIVHDQFGPKRRQASYQMIFVEHDKNVFLKKMGLVYNSKKKIDTDMKNAFFAKLRRRNDPNDVANRIRKTIAEIHLLGYECQDVCTLERKLSGLKRKYKRLTQCDYET